MSPRSPSSSTRSSPRAVTCAPVGCRRTCSTCRRRTCVTSSSAAAQTLLVVEDDPTINQAVADRLVAEGFRVIQAFDGPGAVAAHGEHAPDLVVLDLMLPGFDGLEVCRRIQGDRPVPVLMLTARADETDLLVGLGVGADDYVTKPFRMREVVARV